MSDRDSILSETASLLATRELAAIATLRTAPGLAPDPRRAESATRLLQARTRHLRRIQPDAPVVPDSAVRASPSSWTVLAVDVTVGAGLEVAFFRSLAAHLPASDEEWLRSLLEAEPGAPRLLWSDAARAHLEARRALHRVVRTATEALLASAELAAALGRTSTLELFADTLDAFPTLVARAAAAR